jgi:hypothetical protein
MELVLDHANDGKLLILELTLNKYSVGMARFKQLNA